MRTVLIAAALLIATPALAEDAAPPENHAQEVGAWAREQLARLSEDFEVLKEKVGDWGRQAEPALEGARERFNEHRPEIEAASQSLWERLKLAAIDFADAVRAAFSKEERREP